MDKSSEENAKVVLRLPEFPSDIPRSTRNDCAFSRNPRKEIYTEKGSQTMDHKLPDEYFHDFLEQPLDGSPNKPYDESPGESSDESSVKSEHAGDTSPSYPSDDTEPMDIRESEAYINASSEKERRRLIKKQNKINRIAAKMVLRRKIRAGKKAIALGQEDLLRRRAVADWHNKKRSVFENELTRVQQCRAAEDRARDLSEARGADGRNWSDDDQRILELQRVNEDFIRLKVELYSWRPKKFEGQSTLHYRADEINKLLRIFDVQWREAYERIADNLVKIKEQRKHSAEQNDSIRTIEKGPKTAAGETVRSKRAPPIPTTTTTTTTTKNPALRKPAKAQREKSPPPQKLRRSSRLSAKRAS